MKFTQLPPATNNVDMSSEPGGVWFGDPCYVYPDGRWHEFCDAMFSYEKIYTPGRHYVGQVTSPTSRVWYVWSTAFGDGSYRLQLNGNTVSHLGAHVTNVLLFTSHCIYDH